MKKSTRQAKHDLVWRASAEADEYFRLLGGSGRYIGYRNWHVPALLILLLTGCDPNKPDFLFTEDSHLIDPDLWIKTDGLPQKISSKLNGHQFDPQLFDEYLIFATSYICRLKDTKELMGWAEFLIHSHSRLSHLT